MKAFQYITILLFALASVFFGCKSYGQSPSLNDVKPSRLASNSSKMRYYFVSYFIVSGTSIISSNFGVQCDCLPTYKELLEDAKYDNKQANHIDLPANKYCIQGFSEFKNETEYKNFFGNNFRYTKSRK